jgi:hypothetical protein
MNCPACDCGFFVFLGILGNRAHYRCRDCGLDCSRELDEGELEENLAELRDEDDRFDESSLIREL